MKNKHNIFLYISITAILTIITVLLYINLGLPPCPKGSPRDRGFTNDKSVSNCSQLPKVPKNHRIYSGFVANKNKKEPTVKQQKTTVAIINFNNDGQMALPQEKFENYDLQKIYQHTKMKSNPYPAEITYIKMKKSKAAGLPLFADDLKLNLEGNEQEAEELLRECFSLLQEVGGEHNNEARALMGKIKDHLEEETQ